MATEKQHYEEMNERQQAFADAYAEVSLAYDDVTFERVSEQMEKKGVEMYTESTFENYRGLFSDVITKRIQILSNPQNKFEGAEGVEDEEIEVERGNRRFKGKPVDATYQDIKDRPVQGEPVETREDHYAVELSDEEIVEILNSDVSEEVRFNIFKQISG